MSTFRYSATIKDDKTIIKLGGSLDVKTAPKLDAKINEAINNGSMKIILNLSSIDYIASAGLGVMVSNNSKLRKIGGEIRISSMSEKIDKIFKLLGFNNLFKSYKNDDEALRSF